MVAIAYQFIFEKDANIWNNIAFFEQDLADFFKTNGVEADIVNTVQGSSGGRIMLLRKIDAGQTLENIKGVDLRNKPGIPSQASAAQLTQKLTQSFNKQYTGKNLIKKKNKLLK